MKSNLSKYIEEVVSGFLNNRGKASVYCFPPISYADTVYNIILKYRTKNPDASILVVVEGYTTRKAIIDILDKYDIDRRDIKVLSVDYIKMPYRYNYGLTITVGVNENYPILYHLYNGAKFMLSIFTKNIMDNSFITQIRSILPSITTTVSNNSVRSDSIYSPVEEYRRGAIMLEEDAELYAKYTNYINTSISIFGDLSNIEKCKYGDAKLNISSAEYRDMIAKDNGWNEHLDTTMDFHKQIDDIYNPNVLYERANNFYTITKQRRDLLTDNNAKLPIILDIVKNNMDKKILIVSKRGDFAAKVTKYLNAELGEVCGDYHDCIEDAISVDDNGFPILVKSGVNKGKPKIIGSQAISTANLKRFNGLFLNSNINVLSIKNSSNNKLKTSVDLIILTSVYCDDIIAVKTRFSNVVVNGVPNIVYKLYCKDTSEQVKLNEAKETPLIKVIDDNENFIEYDDENNTVII